MIISHAPPPKSMGVHTLQYVHDVPGEAAPSPFDRLVQYGGLAAAGVGIYALLTRRKKLQRAAFYTGAALFIAQLIRSSRF